MVSTYLNYRLFAADLDRTLVQQASQKQLAREAAYYKANIGKVTSVDAFLKNQRLYAYAMKAYGLEDMTYAKGFMRKVLQSDQADGHSFVNKLIDPRFLAFAKAFNFKSDGTVTTVAARAQDTTHEYETIGLYSDRRIQLGSAAATSAKYFQNTIGSIRSVDAFLSNSKLFDFALKAFDIDPSIASKATIKAVLTSDLSDSNSLANQLTNDSYRLLAGAFAFQTDGSVADGQFAQSDAQTSDTIYAYYQNNDLGASPAGASFTSDYYKSKIAGITNVDDMLNDGKLFDFVTTAFGFEPLFVSKITVRDVLTSDLSDPNSVANTQSAAGYRKMAEAFNFNSDGSLDSGVAAQTADQLETTLDGFFVTYDDVAARHDKYETDYYAITIGSVASVQELQKNTKLYNVVLQAFGLDPDVEPKSKIAQVLTSDLADPYSYANTTRDPRLKALAGAFNFDSKGVAQVVRKAQTDEAKLATAKLYSANVGDATALQKTTTDENGYYGVAIDNLRSVDGLLADNRLVSYVLKAYGFTSAAFSNDTLRKVLTSDLQDPTSYANKPGNLKYRELALAFNFAADGSARRATLNQVQDFSDQVRTSDLYLRQSVEQSAGDQSEGARLALYFQRKAPTIVSAYSILADKALLQVVRTALGLPESMSNAELDLQANMITRKLNVADLKDPVKLEKFIARFSAVYDVTNASTDSASLVASLFA